MDERFLIVAEGKASSASSVVEMEKLKMIKHSVGGTEKRTTVEAEGKGGYTSWVVEIDEKMLEDTKPSAEMARWKQHSIYRVPEFVKEMTNRKAYEPRFVSLGPLHYGEPHLLPMEKHKRRAVLHMVRRAGKPIGVYIAAIEEVADELEGSYADLDGKWSGANRGSFVELMLTDGCFLLELIRKHQLLVEQKVDQDYTADDPVFGTESYQYLWPTLLNDMIAMENQLPLLALQRLFAVQHSTSLCADAINLVLLILCRPIEEGVDNHLGVHILDIYHKSYSGTCPHWAGRRNRDEPTPCAVELAEAGIQFKKSDTHSIHDVDFRNGVLSMPLFPFYDTTEEWFLNMMAFELLHRGAGENIRHYISFVDKIIESERDVALLRSEKLLLNMTGSDKKVAEMFNTLTRLALANRHNRLSDVQAKVNAHCRKRPNKWRASLMRTHLSNPWVIISLLAAIVLLVATCLQTVYTIVPFYTRG